jgi:hypothetical protein
MEIIRRNKFFFINFLAPIFLIPAIVLLDDIACFIACNEVSTNIAMFVQTTTLEVINFISEICLILSFGLFIHFVVTLISVIKKRMSFDKVIISRKDAILNFLDKVKNKATAFYASLQTISQTNDINVEE